MSPKKESMRHAGECVRLAGLTDDPSVRNQLMELAQDWIAAAQRKRPSSEALHDKGDDARVVSLRFPQGLGSLYSKAERAPVPSAHTGEGAACWPLDPAVTISSASKSSRSCVSWSALRKRGACRAARRQFNAALRQLWRDLAHEPPARRS